MPSGALDSYVTDHNHAGTPDPAGPSVPVAVRGRPYVRRRGPARAGRPAGAGRSGEITAVVVGRNRQDTSNLLHALLAGTPPLLAVPDGCYLVLRSAGRRGARAFVPGYRLPRPYPPPDERHALPRPPRRVESGHGDTLLTQLTVVLSPPLDTGGPAQMHVIVDLLERGAALVLVTDTAQPLDDAEMDLLAAAERHGRPVFLAVSDESESERWPEVVGANQSRLARGVPDLVLAPWYVVTSGDAGADGAIDLRQALLRWAASERSRRVASGRTLRSTRAVAVGPHSSDCGWERVLERAVHTHRQRAGQRVSIEVARIHLRCAQLVTDRGCAALPAALDAELHGLSALATRGVQAGAIDALVSVLSQVLEHLPEPGVLRRVVRAIRGHTHGAEAEIDRALMVITTADVAEVVGAGALAGMSAYRPVHGAIGDPGVLPHIAPPIGLGLTAGCFPLWTDGADPRRCLQWLQRVLRAVDVVLQREVDGRFADLELAVGDLMAAGIGTGVLPV